MAKRETREERVEGRRAEREGEEPVETIPAPGVPGSQSTVNMPEQNYPEPGTGPKQPGFTMSHTQNLGESNEEFQDRALDAEEEAKAQTEQQREEQAKQDEERVQQSTQEMEKRDQEREQRRQERRQEREQAQAQRQEARQEEGSGS